MSDAVDDPSHGKASRRKACDLCFTKKIKCDMIQPVCSNCVLYKSDCRTTIIRRKGNGHKSRPPAAVRVQSSPPSEPASASTEERLTRIERQLQQIIDVSLATGERLSSATTSTTEDDDAGSLLTAETSPSVFVNDHEQALSRLDSTAEEFPLPKFEEVLPIVQHYFSVFSHIVPLFDKKSFMGLLSGWYSSKGRRSSAVWAAIQIVLAISLRTPAPGTVFDGAGSERSHAANLHLKHAQSVVSDLVCREEDLLGIQVLLGITMLFQNSSDPKPASVFIGTAMRLAHRLQLHSQQAARHFSPEENEQRSRVFWTAYTLDKDISLRMNAPSVQSDLDIDLPLPSLAVSDGVGLVWTQDSRSHINYHRMRVDLAHIQGQVYDLLYSNRSSKVPKEERQRRICRLQGQLDRWYQRVPAAFQIEHAASTLDAGELIMMTNMHYAYLMATIMTHGLYSYSADWIRRLSSPGRGAIQDLATYMDSCASPGAATSQSPPFPGGWSRCVELSRECMKLFERCAPTECLIWYCTCPHFSGHIILLANMLINPTHEYVSLDQHLATKAMQLFDKVLELAPSEPIRKIRVIVDDLHARAMEAVEKSKSHGRLDGEDILDSFNPNPYAAHDSGWTPDSGKSGEMLLEPVTDPKANDISKNFDAYLWENLPSFTNGWASAYSSVGSGQQ